MPTADKQNTITRFSLTEENFVGNAKYKIKDYDLMEIVMVCLGGKEGSENYDGLIKFLDVLTSMEYNKTEKKDIIENEYNIKMTKEIEREVLGMCNLSDGIYNKGLSEGLTKGRSSATLDAIRILIRSFASYAACFAICCVCLCSRNINLH